MPNQKMKSENYSNLGGINIKSSPAQNTPLEFLSIINYDFQSIGALSQRWGSTMYVGQTFAGKINTLVEYQKLDGSSYVIIGHSGGVWSGATTGNSQGLSFTQNGVTLVNQIAIGVMAFFGGALRELGTAVTYKDDKNRKFSTSGDAAAQSGVTRYINPEINGKNKISSIVFQDWLFMADGEKFVKYNGLSTYNVGLPPPLKIGVTNLTTSTNSTTLGFGISSGHWGLYAQYVNNRGLNGPVWPIGNLDATGQSLAGSLISFEYVMSTPLAYGISAINFYSYCQSATMTTSSGASPFWFLPYRLLQTLPASGSSISAFNLGTTLGGMSAAINNLGSIPTDGYDTSGLTYTFGGITLSFDQILNFYITKKSPRFLSTYKDRVFACGFSSSLSEVVFSDTGEPEGFPPENTFEVRTNDGDFITGMRPFKSALMIFKQNSFHAYTGDNVNNFLLQELSTEYGCVNHWSVTEYNNSIVFLDRKGLMKWNGSGIENISLKVQPIFDRLNYQAALEEACVSHDKLRNQIVVSMPIDGATLNNKVMVYDYLINAWTEHQGYAPSILAAIQGRNQTKNLFSGTYSGIINWFGPSFITDNASAMTLSFKSRFINEIGESTTKQYRRLYLNISPIGATLNFGVNLYQDYGTSIVVGTTIVMSGFQDRIDFGVAAKSLAVETIHSNVSNKIVVHGFTTEERMQRRV